MTAPPSTNPLLGVGLKLASILVFTVMAVCLKASFAIPTGQLVFFRSFFAILPILVFLAWRRELIVGFKTKRIGGHFLRGMIGVCAMGCGFYAITRLPLPESTTIGYASPMLIVALSALVLKEQVRLYRWSAVLVGLCGVLIAAWPHLTIFGSTEGLGAAKTIAVIVAFAGTIFSATAMLTIRSLVRTERSATVVLYFSITCSLISLITLPAGWVWPDPTHWALLIGAGIAGGIAQVMMTEAYRHAEASMIAPFDYTSLILSIAAGYIFFADIPTPWTLVGGAIVVSAGIFIILREHRLGIERAAAKKATLPQA